MSTAASFSESLRARDERQPTQKTVAEDIVDESRTLAQKQTKVSHVEKKPAEYALPSESDDDGKSRAREEALWARAITEEPPKNGSTEEFSRCCHRFEALYCAYLKQPFSRCLPPTPSFVATLLAGWSRHPVHVLDLRKIKKKEDLKAIRGLLAHSPAPSFTAPIETLTKALALVPSPLTTAALALHNSIINRQHRDVLQQGTALLNGGLSSNSSSTSLTSSQSSTSTAALGPAGSAPFLHHEDCSAGHSEGPLSQIERQCLVTECFACQRAEEAYALPHGPRKAPLQFALKMYLVLVSKIVPPDFVFHDVSNVMLLQNGIHSHFDKRKLLIIPDIVYIRTLYEYLRLKPGPFGYEAFLAYLAASFPQLLPSNLTYRVLALRPQLMTSIVVETQEKTYRSDADGIFRERNCPPPGAELPPRSFFRKAEDGVAEPWMNPLLLIVDAATKLLAVEMSA